MNVNLKFENVDNIYVYDDYTIEQIHNRKYIFPKERSKRKIANVIDNLNMLLTSILNIGKKAYFYEVINDFEIIEFAKKFGLFGFMADMPINKLYVLDDIVYFRDYNFKTSTNAISKLELTDYINMFMPKATKKEINKLTENVKNKIILDETDDIEEKTLSKISESTIYSTNYAEPVDEIIYYARELYKTLFEYIENKNKSKFPAIADSHNTILNINKLSSGKLNIKYFYLKQIIDLYFSMQLSQEIRLLKICNFCSKAFIAKNPKAEYDTPQCKNKANVYKSRGKIISRNSINTGDEIIAKIPNQRLSESIIKDLNQRIK